MSNSKCLAQKAMHLYDQQGEDEMISFVRQRLDPRPTGHEHNPSSLAVLDDHSAIPVRNDRYLFLWTPSDDEPQHPLPPARSRKQQDQPFPTPIQDRPLNIGGLVTRERIVYETLKHIEINVRLGLGQSEVGNWIADDHPMTDDELMALSPRLISEIDRLSAEQVEQDAIYELMDTFGRDTAKEALPILTHEQRIVLDEGHAHSRLQPRLTPGPGVPCHHTIHSNETPGPTLPNPSTTIAQHHDHRRCRMAAQLPHLQPAGMRHRNLPRLVYPVQRRRPRPGLGRRLLHPGLRPLRAGLHNPHF